MVQLTRFLWCSGMFMTLFCLLGAFPHPVKAQVAAGTQIPLGLNIDTDEQAYVDLIQPDMQPAGVFSALSGQSSTLLADAQGWPMGDFQFTFDNRYVFEWFAGAPNVDPLHRSTDISGLYQLSFTGQATLGGWGMSVTNQVYRAATNTTTATVSVPNPAGGAFFGLQFTGTRRLPTDSPGTGVTNVHFIRPGYTPGTPQVFTDLWLSSIVHYPWNALRFNGVLGTQGYAQPESNEAYPYRLQWATDRAIPGDGPLSINHAGVHGMPWEQVAWVAAATGKDVWINVPVNASDDYVTQLAALLHASLPASTHIYLEYSNEMWHLGFPQGPWNKQAAQDEVAAGTSNLNYDGIGNIDVWRLRRIAKRTVEIGIQFKTVFGDNGTRIRPVIDNEFVGFDPDILTYVTKNYGPPSQFLYGISQTGYYSSTDQSSVAAVLAGEKAASDVNAASYVQSRTIATFYGLHSLAYEGGQGDTGNGTPGPPFWGTTDLTLPTLFSTARDPGMQAVEMHDLIGNWFPSGGDLYMQFGQAGHYSTYGFWGMSDDLTNQTSGKWLGMIQAMSTPAPVMTASTPLPSVVGGTVSVPETTPPNSNFNVPSDQPWLEKLMQAPVAGTYTLSLAGRQSDQSAPLSVWVDNALVGTVSLPSGTEGSSAPTLSFALTPGLHSLFIYGPPGSGPGGVSTQTGDSLTLTLGSLTPSHVLWTNTNGTAALWNYSPTAGTYTVHNFGPYAGWTAKAIADGGTDGKTRLLWTNTDGSAALWSVTAATGTFTASTFGPYAGWTASAVSVSSDNTTHLLWTNTSGQAALWNVTSGHYQSEHDYGPYPGWMAKSIADGGTDGRTRLLWTNTSGQAALWSVSPSSGTFSQFTFGPYTGWNAQALSVSSATTHVLWTNANGTAAVWNYTPSTGGFVQHLYGPYTGWAATALADGSDGKVRLLWDNVSGQAAFWSMNNTTGVFGQFSFGAYSGWNAVAISAP